jgi:hypothetical protein
MTDFKMPEGEKFFAFMVWVALIGAALILAIDYTMKRQLLSLAMELREGGLNEQAVKGRFASAANSPGNNAPGNVGVLSGNDDAGMEKKDAPERVAFPVRKPGKPRQSNGKFAPKEPDDSGRNRDPEVPAGDSGLES